MVRVILNVLLLSLLVLLAWITITGGQQLHVGNIVIGLRNHKNPAILLLILMGLRLFLFPSKLQNKPSEKIFYSALHALLFFCLCIVCVKLFVSALDAFYFLRPLQSKDLLSTFSLDLSLAWVGFMMLLGLVGVSFLRRADKNISMMQRAPTKLIYATLTLFTWLIIGVSMLYVLLGYTYLEWGSFIEPHHIEAMTMAGVGSEFSSLFFRWHTLASVIIGFALYLIAYFVMNYLEHRKISIIKAIVIGLGLLLPAVLSFSAPLGQPDKFAPTVQSPLLLLLQPIAKNTDGIKTSARLAKLKATDFKLSMSRPIKPEFQVLEGVAKDFNVIFFVMESVRRRNLGIYGYSREPMPYLASLAKNALVFNNAYVMQPRSSKAMSAISLGVMPDPRLRPISWDPWRIKRKKTLFNLLMKDGRRFYLGTAQPAGGDNLQNFFSQTVDHKVDKIVTHETLIADASVLNDDIGLSQDFVRWVSSSRQAFSAILWTECAHFPYITERAPFGRTRLLDKYDNCLNQVDFALREMIQQLEAQHQLDKTLVIILGDHGEALGEKFDRVHGSYLYEHSMRIPVMIYNPLLFNQQTRVDARFQLKDVPSTLLYLLGLPSQLNQSENIFSKEATDKVYMSNVYQDYKLGMITDDIKFIYRPRFDMSFAYDLKRDPGEHKNIVHQFSVDELKAMQDELLVWYKFQTQYIDSNYPKH